jgi:alpha-1,2-mannosyltransferase
MSAVAQLRSGEWLSAERLKKYPVIFLVIYLVVGILWLTNSEGYIDPTGKPLGTDFLNQYAASVLIHEGSPELAYDTVRHGAVEKEVVGSNDFGYYGWHYPPMALFIVVPFALFSYGMALSLWMAVTLTANVFAIRRIVNAKETLLVALAFPAVLINIGHGHNGFLSGALLGGALLLLGGNRQIAAGVLIGLLAYKPQFGVLIPVALAAGAYWRAFGSAVATVCMFGLCSWWVFGAETWTGFLASMEYTRSYILEQGATGWEKIQSFFSLVRGLGGGIELAYAIQAIAMIVMAGLVFVLWRGPNRFNLKAAGLVVASLLATPYLLDYDLIILGVAIVFLIADGRVNGFIPWERSLLALLWVWPLFARSFGVISGVQLTPLLLCALLWLLIKKRDLSVSDSA